MSTDQLLDEAIARELEGRRRLVPPWVKYPEIPRGSIGWRMGAGEWYARMWSRWIDRLASEDVREYWRLYEPIPFPWAGWALSTIDPERVVADEATAARLMGERGFRVGTAAVDGAERERPGDGALRFCRQRAVREVAALARLAEAAWGAEERFFAAFEGRPATWAHLVRLAARRRACLDWRAALPADDGRAPALDREVGALAREIVSAGDAIRRGGSQANPESILREAEPLIRDLGKSESLPHEIPRLDSLRVELAARAEGAEGTAAREYRALDKWVEARRDDLQDAANAIAGQDWAALERMLHQIDARLSQIRAEPSEA